MLIWIINGPNLNLLGRREPEIYGHRSFEQYFEELKAAFPRLDLRYFQSNHEGAILDHLQSIGFGQSDGLVFNPAAFTHTSIAIGDCLAAIQLPCVEVHISDIYKREAFRHHSYIKPYCIDSIVGQGLDGYRSAVAKLSEYLSAREARTQS
ncbi:MAG TPA: type II 3-dehydroquinate dehydratase [Saprospiraceae bacterium]|nr:type II 3-dehydroquinate dehydratase [Saprospiraceae bacterium]HNT19786.1 type II 3-dehydroquinate dehydratase [Saprospiraceae bacterium]